MNFLTLPTEIRLQIYSELLVLQNAIIFDRDPLSSAYMKPRRRGLHPEILRVSSQVYHESKELLYAHNTFQFLNPLTSIWPVTASVISFCQQINTSVKFIRSICIDFPVHEAQVESLGYIQEQCTSLTHLEFCLDGTMAFILDNSPCIWEILQLLDLRLKEMTSLRHVTVKIKVHSSIELSSIIIHGMWSFGWAVELIDID